MLNYINKNNRNNEIKKNKFDLNRQIRLLYVNGVLSNFSITAAWVVIMAARGFSLVQIGFAETVFHITSLICEIPSGMLADIHGRKKMLALGRVMAITGDLIVAFSTDYWLILLAMPFHAMAYNFASGSGEALAYDSMKLKGAEAGYERYTSNQSIIYRVVNGISTMLAGLALYLGFKKSYLISALTGAIALFFTLKLIEVRCADEDEEKSENKKSAENGVKKDVKKDTKKKQKEEERKIFGKMVDFFVDSIKFLFHNSKAAKLMFLNSFVGSVDILLLFFLQSKLRSAGMSNWILGPALFIMEIGGIVGAKLILKARNVKYFKVFIICTAGVLAGVLLEHTGIVWVMVLGGFISAMADDAIEIRTNAKLQDMFPSEQRATLISISSFTFSVIMIVLSPLAGWFFGVW